uniref:XRE family transcriptional regulator n=1 Tax=Fervidicoccus fontis TaxID=683846 RepID=A0A7J3SLM4_9CREN
MSEILGQRIRELREEKRISQKAMADFLNTTRQRYARIEKGEIDITYKDLCRIASKLGVDPNQITSSLKEEKGLVVQFRELSNAEAAAEKMAKVEEILRVFFAHKRVWKRMFKPEDVLR